jgi:hypothetical protein
MAARVVWSVDEDGVSRRWCNGPCGRRLDASNFYQNGRGYPDSRCRGCHRVSLSALYRSHYQNNKRFRARERRRKRTEYAAKVAA